MVMDLGRVQKELQEMSGIKVVPKATPISLICSAPFQAQLALPTKAPLFRSISHCQVKRLVEMGFPEGQARSALETVGGDENLALESLCSG